MRIRLAILDHDQNYLDRLISAFTTRYAENLQIYSYSDYETAVNSLRSIRAHVFLVSSVFEVDEKKVPKNCGIAYLVENTGIATHKGYPAVCKFQKLDLIYKQILNIYTEFVEEEAQVRPGENTCNVTFFMSPAGGVGTTTVAAACAEYYASIGQRTLYLNLNPYDTVESFFQSDGTFNFKNVIKDVKSKKTNLALRFKSYLQQDSSGVYFFASSPLALDILEIHKEDYQDILSALIKTGEFDEIVIDSGFDLRKDNLNFLKMSTAIIVVADGKEVSNRKIKRAQESFDTLDRNGMTGLVSSIYLIYNRFDERNDHIVEDIDWMIVGAIPELHAISPQQLIMKLSQMQVFDKIH